MKKVELIRNGKVIQTFTTDTYHLEFTYDDMEPAEKVCINAKDKKPIFSYYYLRVTQEDGNMAWSSPIWVDYIPLSSLPKNKVLKVPAKPVPKKILILTSTKKTKMKMRMKISRISKNSRKING